ncbi:MAG TPA: alpha/beta hydrolase-fold protein, partial [Polyangiaceae bacterium]
YMHDGQNLFDPTAAFGGNPWWAQNAVDAAAESGAFAEVIIVGPENTADRIPEYTPVVDPTVDAGGALGEQYCQMLIQELKPKIDATYRTIPDRDHTFMMGSSLGGLITAYASVEHADVYGGFGALSPSTWWDNTWILGEVAKLTSKTSHPNKVYVDSGNAGPSNDDVTNTANLAAAYQSVGFAPPQTLDYLVQNGGQHSEIYWAQRAPGALAFLVGPRALLP